jgi:hypothetical protein
MGASFPGWLDHCFGPKFKTVLLRFRLKAQRIEHRLATERELLERFGVAGTFEMSETMARIGILR